MIEQQARERRIYFSSDASELADATRARCATHSPVIDASAQLPASACPGDLVVVLADVRAAPRIREIQREAIARKIDSLIVALEPGFVWLGPYTKGGGAGCFGCLQLWMHNNLRQPAHWSAVVATEAALARQPQSPLAPSARQLYLELLSSLVTTRWLSPEAPSESTGSVLRLKTRTMETSRHNFIAFPSCPSCQQLPVDLPERARVRMQPRLKRRATDYRAPNPALSVERLRERFVDRRSGLVKHVFHDLASDLMPLYAAEMPIMGSPTTEKGFGRTETRRTSETVAILEILERFAGHTPRRTQTLVRASYNEVRDQAIDPRDFVLHAPEQQHEPGFALAPYSDDLQVDWIWAHSFRRDAPVLMPQQLAYYWLADTPQSPVNRFLYDSSSGCALGGSVEEAMLYGLMESVERDAYLTTWYGRFTPRELDLSTVNDARVQALVARSDAEGFELHVFDARLDIDVPVIWSMIVDPRPDAPVKSYCAAAAHFKPEQAIFSALVEVVTSMAVYQRTFPGLRERAMELYLDDSKVQTMEDHVLLYSVPETIERFDFLLAGGPKVAVRDAYAEHARAPKHMDLTRDLDTLIERVLRVADDVLVVDQTFPALREAGLNCVKVITPGLMPVSFGHQHRRVSLERVNRYRRSRNLDQVASRHDLNPFPHNFP